MLDQDALNKLVEDELRESIRSKIDQHVEKLVKNTIDNLVLDEKWLGKIENLVDRSMVDLAQSKLRDIDLNLVLSKIVLDNKEIIVDQLKTNFSTNGITDQAKTTQLTVLEDAVVVESELYANDFSVERNTSL